MNLRIVRVFVVLNIIWILPVYSQKRGADSLIKGEMQKLHIQGFEAVAIHNGEIVWTGYYGYQDVEKRRLFRVSVQQRPSCPFYCFVAKSYISVQMEFVEDLTFRKITAGELRSHGRSFENCTILNSEFQNADLSDLMFADCQFRECNLALCNVGNTAFQNVLFMDCKLVGIDFSKAGDFLFEVSFENCLLDNAIFYKKKNKSARFSNCSLVEADFSEADLSNVVFDNCNFFRAFFDRSVLKGADFTTSYNYSIDPDTNIIKKAKFSASGLPGLLAKYDIIVK